MREVTAEFVIAEEDGTEFFIRATITNSAGEVVECFYSVKQIGGWDIQQLEVGEKPPTSIEPTARTLPLQASRFAEHAVEMVRQSMLLDIALTDAEADIIDDGFLDRAFSEQKKKAS